LDNADGSEFHIEEREDIAALMSVITNGRINFYWPERGSYITAKFYETILQASIDEDFNKSEELLLYFDVQLSS